MFQGFKKYYQKKRQKTHLSVEELRRTFQDRYHQFKLLLNANNKALEVMTEMEDALNGSWPFGMAFVRSRVTSVSTNVFQIVRLLNGLAPDKYKDLLPAFKSIQQNINPFMESQKTILPGAYILTLEEVHKDLADQVGSKMANLGELKNKLLLNVPNGFVMTAQAYFHFMEYNDLHSEIDRRIQATQIDRPDELFRLSAGLQKLIIQAPLPKELSDALLRHFKRLEQKEGKRVTLAVRSSALGEDLLGTSFAGQYRSELNVDMEHILQAYKEVLASKYSVPAMTYRFNRGIRGENVAMCVGCLVMIDALAGGVVYTRNPIEIQDPALIINSVWGLPKSVVDGSTPADLFIVTRGAPMTISRKEIPPKEQKFICYPEEGVCRLDLTGEESLQASLTDEQVLDLAGLSEQVENYHGGPQDIEWALTREGKIVLLQCRPLAPSHVQPDRLAQMAEPDKSRNVLLQGGITASPGTASGTVFVLQKDMEALHFPKGAVLVTSQALPRWAMLINRAVGVITEKGSIAGHLANVAREFNVPALFGVEGATRLLSPQQIITLDANSRRVYEGRIEALLQQRAKPTRLMEGSPVLEALRGAAKHIMPLNLLDPDAPQFRAKNCRTLHDITRFCHEKAVSEMFEFGKEHHFPERSSKQLIATVPMQWWILNLDDGFHQEVDGKFVQLDNIASVPMLAIWRGITAFKWEGPPPIDGKGLVSVMFQATTNTHLVTGVRSQYAVRNYFIIAKNYCSLSSRLGFHFTMVEALVSERTGENYIRFRFKGGAADLERRIKRVRFIQEILEGYDFRVEVKEDNVTARIEDREESFMLGRLSVLGYLTMHTRQLDMIMSNPDLVNHYRAKMQRAIRELLAESGSLEEEG